MPVRLARGVITPRSRYVCPYCRSQNASLAGGQTRYQHTAPNGGGHTTQESIPKNLGVQNDSSSRSSIGNIIRAFMSRPDQKHKEPKGDSGNDSHEEPGPALEGIPSIVPKPKDSTDVLQRKLQQKFAAQRRKDLLAMQASQALNTAEGFKDGIKDVSKVYPVRESIKQSPKKRSKRAERAERKRTKRAERKRTKAKNAKVAVKRVERRRVKTIDSAKKKVAEVVTLTQPPNAEESPTSISAYAGNPQKISEAAGKEVNETDSAGNVSGKQRPIALKLDDIMDVLESSKKDENLVKKVRKTRGMKTRSTISEEATRSLDQSKLQILLEQALHTRLATDNSPSGPSMEAPLSDSLSKQSYRKHIVRDPNNWPAGVTSLRAALEQNSEKVKGTDLKSRQHSSNIKKAGAPPKLPLRKIQTTKGSPQILPLEKTRNSRGSLKLPIEVTTASDLELLPVTVDQPPVPKLAYGLERVLFNPGVYQLQDPRSRVYNFDPYLQKIMPIAEFDFNALKEYITSSRDESLSKIAKKHGKRYMGSTSSMTDVLSHFHFLLSQWRDINPSMLSQSFPVTNVHFTELSRSPSAIFLKWKDGSYAIDADKEFANASVLTMLGKSMEKLLTLSTDDFERYRKSNPNEVSEDERFAPESYHYSTLGDLMMRSQLDAHDPRLPGTGMFDLKTRSVVSIRMDVANYEHGVGYEIKSRQGGWESYEREYYDMIRAAFLKYSMQVRMGRMDGIFVAYHNVERIFGFQYISLPEMDCTIHGQRDTSIGDQEFRLSLDLLNEVLDRATKKYPETSLRIHFETREAQTPFMYVFAEPVTEEQVAEIQSQNSAKIQQFERNILGLTRGNGSETDDAREVDPKWEKIQADVQKAMEKDELSDDGLGQGQEAIDEGAEVTEYTPTRPEVFEHGPLYATKSAADADGGAFAASAGNEEDEDDTDGEGECENEEEEEEGEGEGEGEGDLNDNEEVEESRRQEGPEELPEGETDINAIDIVEAERSVDGDGTDEKYPAKFQNTTNLSREEPNDDNTPGATFGQQSINDASEPKDDEQNNRVPPNPEPNAIVQADTTAISPPSQDILAMTLTIRNKVNGKDVLRPIKMTAADEWSIEYSLTEIPTQSKAMALYHACQMRRKKKMESSLIPDDAEEISAYIQNLRNLSRQGRRWRKRQDKMDRERPVQVLSERGREGGVNNQER